MPNTPAANSQHFPDDPVWQRHCELMARFRAADLNPIGFAADALTAIQSRPLVGRAA